MLQLELLALRKQQQEMEQFMKDERSDKDSRYRNYKPVYSSSKSHKKQTHKCGAEAVRE